MQQALDADEASLTDLALQLYTQAVELAVNVVSIILVIFIHIKNAPYTHINLCTCLV